VTERLRLSKIVCLLFADAAESQQRHVSHKRRGVGRGLDAELFIDVPSNKLFPAECSLRNNGGEVVLPYKRADDFCETKCRARLLPRRGIVQLGCVSCNDDAFTVVTTTEKY